MKRATALVSVLVAAAACSDPAALEVRVKIVARDLAELRLVVGKGDLESSTSFVDCTLPLNGEPAGTCGFEAGTNQWDDPGETSFVLYGEPDTDLAVSIDGYRMGRSVTATRAATALPPNPGERRLLDVALFSRTSERSRCKLEIPEVDVGVPEPDDSNALSVFDLISTNGPAREMVVSAHGNLALANLIRTDEGCEIGMVPVVGRPMCTERATFEWCHVRAGAMVVGPVRPDAELSRVLIGAVCAAPRRLAHATLGGRCADGKFESIPFDAAPEDVSTPVIADIDADGDFELLYTVLNRTGVRPGEPAPMHLIIWRPDGSENALTTVPLGTTVSHFPHAPMVHRTSTLQQVVIAATSPAFGLIEDGMFRPVVGIDDAEMSRAPALISSGDVPSVVRVTTAGDVEVIRLAVGRSAVVLTQPLIEPITADLSVRIALGGRLDSGPINAVIVDDGKAQIFGLERDVIPVSKQVWGDGVASDAQHVLLANVDGFGVADIISYSAQAPQIHARTLEGTPIEGWPLTMTSQTGRRHIVVTDIDGPTDRQVESIALRDLEVVTLSDGQLSIITLGPGSYDRQRTPWPASGHDTFNTATYRGESDPNQANWRVLFP